MTDRGWADPLVQRLAGRRGRAETEALVERIAERWLADARQARLPIAIFALASAHGIRVRRGRSQPFAGRIYADGERLVMDINADDPEPRQRFTCAHELMHTAFPGFARERRYRVDRELDDVLFARSRQEEELLCDLGAAALLMPRGLLAPYTQRPPLDAMEGLAAAATVSLEAAANRLLRVRATPAAFLVLERMLQPAEQRRARRGERPEPRLRVRYALTVGLRTWVPRFADVDDRSVYARATKSGRVERGEQTLPGGRGEDWQVEARAYPRGRVMRVLAFARPAEARLAAAAPGTF
jgi:Zn-dependent peptidase ImmA (M78 family)